MCWISGYLDEGLLPEGRFEVVKAGPALEQYSWNNLMLSFCSCDMPVLCSLSVVDSPCRVPCNGSNINMITTPHTDTILLKVSSRKCYECK